MDGVFAATDQEYPVVGARGQLDREDVALVR
jgi:hypothetical protein